MIDLTETFSIPAADMIKLFKWLQGQEFAARLILKCYALSPSNKISRSTVERALDLMTLEARHAA